jgi:hypothetical protein
MKETKVTKMTKISQRRDIADTGLRAVLTRRGRELGAAELDRVTAAGSKPGASTGGSGAVWPPPPGRN